MRSFASARGDIDKVLILAREIALDNEIKRNSLL